MCIGTFAVLMFQIPVEGGHLGGDLFVRHSLGDTKLDRSQDNGQKFYLSTSFIDCAHEISPVTEGWSLTLTYYLAWSKPLLIAPHGIDLPTFVSSLNTVREILSPLLSPDEECDTEMLVIPLSNRYARTPLCYANLRGTDKFMANLLQSTSSLEIRLATACNYRGGTAYDESRMNVRNRNEDESIEEDRENEDFGYPESPRQLGLEDDQIVIGQSRRFISEVLINRCFFREMSLISGAHDYVGTPFICWKQDYVFSHTIDSISDIFDPVSPPDKEIFNSYYYDDDEMGEEESDLELQQWWFKPVLIFRRVELPQRFS